MPRKPSPRLKMRTYHVTVRIVPTIAEIVLTGACEETREVVICGYTLADAKRRAGIA